VSTFSERVENLLAAVESNALPKKVEPVRKDADGGSVWTPGVVFDGKQGELTTKPKTGPVGDWDEELRQWGFDPAVFEVVEPVRFSTWQTYDERQLWAYKVQVRSKSVLTATELELLTAPVKGMARRRRARPSGNFTLVVPIGDWQIGKRDGDGLEGTVARVEASFDAVLERVTFLRQAGYQVGGLLVASLGDLGEGCQGHYEQQTFGVMLDRRDQNKVVRRLARNALMKLAPEFERVTVAAVPGNHGENRRNGKSFTSSNDNDDVAVWEAVAETLMVREDLFGHIRWLLTRDELSASVQVGSKIVGLAHGHQARSGDIGRWWEGQSLAGRATASADLLLTGHFHHFVCREVAKGRWHIQVPAQDGASDWFEETAGKGSTQGQVTFLLGDEGWTELKIV